MKIRTFLTLGVLVCLSAVEARAQNLEWVLHNTNLTIGERVVAVFDAPSSGNYRGVSLTGQITDNNGNWGYNHPTVANFTVFVKFTQGFNYAIRQDVRTGNLKLRLRQVSPTKVHLVADCPTLHTALRISFRKTIGNVTVSLGNPDVINTSGTLILGEPTYSSSLSGTVNIGNNTLAGALNVNGNIRAKEVKVETANWPDYVFEPDYPLLPLAEIAEFVRKHKHLPEVPDAAAVHENGIDLGEMSLLLLKKVEELTLHLISEQRAREKLEGEVALLKEQLADRHGHYN